MVEGARLESVYRGNSIVGSNPTLSAITFQLLGSQPEIFFSISWVWDGAIDVRLGNCEACGTMQTTDETLPWLQRMIAVHYPNSKYNVERMGGTFNPKIHLVR